MRRSFWVKPGKLTAITAALVFIFVHVPTAKAQTEITYSFTGTALGWQGTTFTIVASNFLTIPTTIAPTTGETDIFGPPQPITSLIFQNGAIEVVASPGGTICCLAESDNYSLSQLGTQMLFVESPTSTGTLSIEETVLTPEPGTAALWLTGIGLLAVAMMRKRKAHALAQAN